jgi:predicted GNAT superfamily acetyltransferase
MDKSDKVVVAATIKGRGRLSGAETYWDVWHVWEIRGGEAVRCQAFMNRAEALEAAGLPP